MYKTGLSLQRFFKNKSPFLCLSFPPSPLFLCVMCAHVRGEQRPALDVISQEPFLSSETKSLIDLELTMQTRWTG